jgi:hypothetical protein
MPEACRACKAPITWCKLANTTGKPEKAHPLDAAPVPEPALKLIAYHEASGRGKVITNAVLDDPPWTGRFDITFHASHFATCPFSKAFRT